MADTNENETLAGSLNKTLEKSKGLIFAITAVIVVAIVAVAVFATLKSKSNEKGIEQIDSISYSLTNESADLSAEDVAARQNKALEELSALTSKGGVVGLRSNMLAAEIKFELVKDPESESGYLWTSVVGRHKPITPGSYCTGSIVIERQPPIEKVFYKISQLLRSR